MSKFKSLFYTHKYEILCLSLIQHLFIGIFVSDFAFYSKIIWPINMIILGIASVGVFRDKGKLKVTAHKLLFGIVFLLPILIQFFSHLLMVMNILNFCYIIFFAFAFFEIMKFLLRPSYINKDVISASICGYLLILEISIFIFQLYFYNDHRDFHGISHLNPAVTYMDFVYFCSITLTSIGFGDIYPTSHITKLLTAMVGISGQLYLVIVMGILISKFSSLKDN
jgi:hypothetical protein